MARGMTDPSRHHPGGNAHRDGDHARDDRRGRDHFCQRHRQRAKTACHDRDEWPASPRAQRSAARPGRGDLSGGDLAASGVQPRLPGNYRRAPDGCQPHRVDPAIVNGDRYKIIQNMDALLEHQEKFQDFDPSGPVKIDPTVSLLPRNNLFEDDRQQRQHQ